METLHSLCSLIYDSAIISALYLYFIRPAVISCTLRSSYPQPPSVLLELPLHSLSCWRHHFATCTIFSSRHCHSSQDQRVSGIGTSVNLPFIFNARYIYSLVHVGIKLFPYLSFLNVSMLSLRACNQASVICRFAEQT